MKTPLDVNMETTWKQVLKDEFTQPYFQQLTQFVEEERRCFPSSIYPPAELVFNALNLTPFDSVKVVIVGQDPYHGLGQADGLAFSVPPGVRLPPSLKNIFKELSSDLGLPCKKEGCLLSWAKQGVLLLNTTLTVRQGEPLSHHGKGWESFTDAIIEYLARRTDPLVFVLWGKSAQTKCERLLANNSHLIITSPHPSPFSAYQGFFGSKPFSKINDFLSTLGRKPIDWYYV